MSQLDTGFKQTRCEAMVNVCYGEKADRVNKALACQGQNGMPTPSVPPTIFENRETTGASASMPPPLVHPLQ
eukprot:3486638-Amphidinium_carterae.4